MNLQPTYATGVAVGVPGMIANEEKCNKVSRTVETAAGIAFGQPAFRGAAEHGAVAGATFAATGAGTADATNTGTTTITASPGVVAPAMQGRYTIVALATSATAPVNVMRPDGTVVGDGVVGTPFTVDGIGPVTLTNASTTVGDRWYVDVTYTANTSFIGLTVLNPAVPAVSANPDFYPQYFTGSFMTMGVMWVTAGGTVTPGQLVYWDPATLKYVFDATKIRIPNTVFDTGAVNNGLVKVATRLR